MRKKIFLTIFLIVVSVLSTYKISKATNSELEVTGNIDEEKNITLNIEATDIKAIEGTINFDNDLLELVGVDEKSNWNIEFNSETFNLLGISTNSSNSEKKEIAIIKLKTKDADVIAETSIYISNIKIIKDDDTTTTLNDYKATLIINEDNSSISVDEDYVDGDIVEDQAVDENGVAIEENGVEYQDELEEEEGDSYIEVETYDYSEEVEYDDSLEIESEDMEDVIGEAEAREETEEMVSEVIEKGEEIKEEQTEEAEEAVEEKKDDANEAKEETKTETEEKKSEQDNQAKTRLPQTGVVITIVPMVLAVILLGVAIYSYKKSKIKPSDLE